MTKNEKLRTDPSSPRSRPWERKAITAAFLIVVVLLSFVEFFPNKIDVQEGEVCLENVIAPRRIVDFRATRILQEQAANNTPPVFDYINLAGDKAAEKVKKLFEALSSMYIDYLNEDAVEALNAAAGTSLTYQESEYLLRRSAAARTELQNVILDVLDKAYRNEIRSVRLSEEKQAIIAAVDSYKLNQTEKQIAKSVLDAVIQPNMLLNEKLTEAARDNARESVFDVVYEAGQTIINMGEIVTAEQILLLKDNGMIRDGWITDEPASSIASFVIILVMAGLYLVYIFNINKDTAQSSRMLVLLLSQLTIALLLAKVLGYFSVYLIPVSFLMMTLCSVFGTEVSMQSNIFYVLFISITFQLDMDSLTYLVISAYTGAVYLKKITSRTDIFKSGLFVSAVNCLLVLVIAAYRNNFSDHVYSYMAYGIGSGIASALLATASLMICESIFNIATPFRLLEISAPGEPLLQKLITNAPGTYHHSLLVSNMAEIAAKNIGANALLARVGSYYHDIGKAEKAAYFKENQRDEHNPHDYISTDISAKIIKNHVPDGVALAEKYKLPPEIIAFIKTHHGTSEVSFFKAKAFDDGYSGEETFCYSGDLPESKEAAVVMLADSVEAAVRSLENHTEEKIMSMIDMIFEKKIKEKQLEKSEITFKELETVKESFVGVLEGVYHRRIRYPGSTAGTDDGETSDDN